VRFKRRLLKVWQDERGQSILLMTFLILMVFTAMVSREVIVSSFFRGMSQNAIEDRMAKELAHSGTLAALDKVRRLDPALDQNGDRRFDFRDGDYTSGAIPLGNGEYKYKIRANYSSERTFYFQVPASSTSWQAMKILIQEGSAQINDWSTIHEFNLYPSRLESVYTATVYPGEYDYQIVARVKHYDTGSSQSLWVRALNYNDVRTFATDTPGTIATADRQMNFLPSGSNDPNVPDYDTQTLSLKDQLDATEAQLDLEGTKTSAPHTFTITSSGLIGSQRYNAEYQVQRDDFLKYSFFSQTNLTFLSGVVVNGYVYAGKEINISQGTPPAPTIFTRLVRVTYDPNDPNVTTWEQRINDSSCGSNPINSGSPCQGEFQRGGAIGDPVQMPSLSDSLTIATERGWVVDTGGTTLNLNLDDFVCDRVAGTASWGSLSHTTPSTGLFEGIIYIKGNINLTGGRLTARTSLSQNVCGLTIIAANPTDPNDSSDDTVGNITIANSLYTGYDSSMEPVNLGLVAQNWIRIAPDSPKIIHINAAIMSRFQTIFAPSDPSTHVVLGKDPNGVVLSGIDRDNDIWQSSHYPGVGCPSDPDPNNADFTCSSSPRLLEVGMYDIDGDDMGQDVETGDNGFGWDESVVLNPNDPNDTTWFLLIRGPIILQRTGSVGPWATKGSTYANKKTRSYQFDPDITSYPPPHFPVPLNATRILSTQESENETDLIEDQTPATPTPDAI